MIFKDKISLTARGLTSFEEQIFKYGKSLHVDETDPEKAAVLRFSSGMFLVGCYVGFKWGLGVSILLGTFVTLTVYIWS